jgi:hypothetical protein
MWDLDITEFKGFINDLNVWQCHFKVQSSYWESNMSSASQEIPCILWN